MEGRAGAFAAFAQRRPRGTTNLAHENYGSDMAASASVLEMSSRGLEAVLFGHHRRADQKRPCVFAQDLSEMQALLASSSDELDFDDTKLRDTSTSISGQHSAADIDALRHPDRFASGPADDLDSDAEVRG
eukprot:scaffold73_cov252-Pinguiococcus_pyrenoidosus.AAC.10